MNLLQTLNIDRETLSSQSESLANDYLLEEIEGSLDEYHRSLLRMYRQQEKDADPERKPYAYDLTNIVLRSALKCGDFLTLSSVIYKIQREIPFMPEEARSYFLPGFYEAAALYHFYDNQLQEAISEIEIVLHQSKINNQTLERCFYYYVSMLLAAYLPLQLEEVVQQYKQQYPVLKYNPLLHLVEGMSVIENHRSRDELLIAVGKLENTAEDPEAYHRLLKAAHLLLAYEDKTLEQTPNIQLFPDSWEQTIRIDYWLDAKKDNRFYYNLMHEHWQARKQVF